MYEKYGEHIQFYMVYIREAHPTDGWRVDANARAGILFSQPKTLEERTGVAQKMCSQLKIKLPPLVDSIDDKTNKAYSAWPDRLYLIGVDGRIVYKGGPGPGGFRASELEAAIEKTLAADDQKE